MLKAGDLFASNSKGIFAWMMRGVQKFWSIDNESSFNHMGFIKNAAGDTVESQLKYMVRNLSDHIGSRVLIARHKLMTKVGFIQGYEAVKNDIGCLYPVWRLIPLLLRVAKFFNFGMGVCSEQTGKFMAGAGFKNIIYGLTPDDWVDRWRIDRDMEIIFDGILTENILKELIEGGVK